MAVTKKPAAAKTAADKPAKTAKPSAAKLKAIAAAVIAAHKAKKVELAHKKKYEEAKTARVTADEAVAAAGAAKGMIIKVPGVGEREVTESESGNPNYKTVTEWVKAEIEAGRAKSLTIEAIDAQIKLATKKTKKLGYKNAQTKK